MAGYTIHLAIMQEYLRKNNIIDKNENSEYIDGVIFPDFTSNKSTTHYGIASSKTNLELFLKDKDLDTPFNVGYFVHLLTDYLFYNKYLNHIKIFDKDIIYNDYDCTNQDIITKYNVYIPKEVEIYCNFIDGNPQILKTELLHKIIDEISSCNIYEIRDEILSGKNHKKWNTYNMSI